MTVSFDRSTQFSVAAGDSSVAGMISSYLAGKNAGISNGIEAAGGFTAQVLGGRQRSSEFGIV